MEPAYKNLGKVRPTVDNNNWSINNKYDLLTIVYDSSSNKSYISRKNVPANIVIDNREYWLPFGVGKFVDNAIININYLDGVSQELVTYTLEEAITRISNEDKRLGVIISFYGNEASDSHTPGWCLYQFMSDDLNDWNNINAWNSIYYNRNKNVGWFRTESELLAIYPFPHKGDYCYIGTSLTSSFVYRCYENGTWINTQELASVNIGITIGGNISISESGTWIVDNEDTGIKAVGTGINEMTYNPSQEDGGTNILQIKLTDGTQVSFPIKNGTRGNSGIIVPDLETFLAELVNDVVTNDATKGLSAAQGVVLNNKISQLGQQVIYDVTLNNNNHPTFASLSALLSDANLSTLIPASVRTGGMSIRFVQTSDNKYVQFRYMGTDVTTAATFTNVANWQGVDDEPTAGSENLVESGGVAEKLSEKENIAITTGYCIFTNGEIGTTVDTTPVQGGAASYCITPCTQGDIFRIKGEGGSAPRLWCFTDENYVILSHAEIGVISTDGIYVKAEQDGYLIANTAAWNHIPLSVEKYVLRDINYLLDKIKDTDDKIDDVDDTLSMLTPQVSELRSDVASSKMIEIKLTSSNLYHNYSFKKGKSYIIIPTSDVNATLTTRDSIGGDLIDIIINTTHLHQPILFSPTSDASYIKSGDPINCVIFEKDGWDDFIHHNKSNTTSVFNNVIEGYYINANLNIGESVNIDNPTQNGNSAYAVVPCKVGDVFEVTGMGGIAPKLYSYIDKDKKLYYNSPISGDGSPVTTIAPIDGFIIVQSMGYNQGYPVTVKKIGNYLAENIENIEKEITGYISHSSNSDGEFMYYMKAGEKYYIENTSNNTVTFSLRIARGTSSEMVKNIPAHGISEFEPQKNYGYIRFGAAVSFNVWKKGDVRILPRIKELEDKTKFVGNVVPSVKFDFNTDMFDFTEEVSDFGDFLEMDSGNHYFTIMDRIYAKFDELTLANADYITKYEPMASSATPAGNDSPAINTLPQVLAFMQGKGFNDYPDYAKGINEEDDYEITPAYKTYIYKLSSPNTSVYNDTFKKKTIVLVGGTHGNETAAPYNLYLFAKCLCEMAKDDYFKLRSAFDIYIIPCLCGYGIYHRSRYNAAGTHYVNINRNYPIALWAEAGQGNKTDKYMCDYTGPSAGSEFETNIVMALTETTKASMLIDHHNYSALNWQFYTEIHDNRLRQIVHESLVDCSLSFIKNKPYYFGTKYQLFVHIPNETAPQTLANPATGTTARWGFEKGLDLASTIEISQCIDYLNGEYDSSRRTDYNHDTFEVSEMSFRNLITRYCDYINH